jgi:hypothetical protein
MLCPTPAKGGRRSLSPGRERTKACPGLGPGVRVKHAPTPGPPQSDHSRGACPRGNGERESSTKGVAQSPFNPLSPPLSKGDSREFETGVTPARGFAPRRPQSNCGCHCEEGNDEAISGWREAARRMCGWPRLLLARLGEWLEMTGCGVPGHSGRGSFKTPLAMRLNWNGPSPVTIL